MISWLTMPMLALALRGWASISKPQIVARSAGLVDQPREDVDQRRLARAIGAEQAEDLPARHLEDHIVERALAARDRSCRDSRSRSRPRSCAPHKAARGAMRALPAVLAIGDP